MIRAVFFDAGQTLLDADPPVHHVYADAFARHGHTAEAEDVREAVDATWEDVASRRAAGLEPWVGVDAERSFWRRFVSAVYARVGGGELPPRVLKDLVLHFAEERHWTVYADVWGT